MRNSEGDFNKVQMLSGGRGLNEGIPNGMKSTKKKNKIERELKCYESAVEDKKGLR